MIVICARRSRISRMLHDELRNLELGEFRAPGEILDGMPVSIPRAEVHLSKLATLPKGLVHQADTLEKSVPIELRRPPHAGDDVAHRHAHRRLLLVFGADNIVRCCALCREPFIEPQENRTDLRVQVPQTLNQFNRKGPIEWLLFELPEGRGW